MGGAKAVVELGGRAADRAAAGRRARGGARGRRRGQGRRRRCRRSTCRCGSSPTSRRTRWPGSCARWSARAAGGGGGVRHAVRAAPSCSRGWRLPTAPPRPAADQPFPARYEPSALPALRDALAREAPARERWPRSPPPSWALPAARRPRRLDAPRSTRRRPRGGVHLACRAALRRAVDRVLRGRARAPGAERRGARGGAQARLGRRPRIRAQGRADRVLAGRQHRALARRGARARPGALRRPDVPTRERAGRRDRRRRDRRRSLAALLAEGGATRAALRARGDRRRRASGRNSGVAPAPARRGAGRRARGARWSSTRRSATASRTRRSRPACSCSPRTPRRSSASAPSSPRASPSCEPEWLEGAALRAGRAGRSARACTPSGSTTGPPRAARRGRARRGRERAREAGAELRIGDAVEAVEARTAARPACARPRAPSRPARSRRRRARGRAALARRRAGRAAVGRQRRGAPAERRRGTCSRRPGIEALIGAGGGPSSLFSIVTAGGVSAVGSTFLRDEPDPRRRRRVLLERGARFLPALARCGAFSARACPRPQSRRRAAAARPAARASRACTWPSGHGAVGHLARPGLGGAGRRGDPRRRRRSRRSWRRAGLLVS